MCSERGWEEAERKKQHIIFQCRVLRVSSPFPYRLLFILSALLSFLPFAILCPHSPLPPPLRPPPIASFRASSVSLRGGFKPSGEEEEGGRGDKMG